MNLNTHILQVFIIEYSSLRDSIFYNFLKNQKNNQNFQKNNQIIIVEPENVTKVLYNISEGVIFFI